ncbi:MULTISPECIES: site-2 protease family protein [unclassified Clostridium]|uniref:site-2 protease family protein n=1 Tax=unclassified Clostridium TaxID=2614128 RepID=UPI0018986484|nr:MULTISPECIES: site-2 protease family protein [unclassified Clostridium]MCR1952565.1 site-2 protease family protein [Clostridium sp. DSM 100503]
MLGSNYLLTKILTVPAILIAFVAQGYAKAKVADKLGDKTPRFQGRLTLNPTAHIDIIGFIMILLVGFGWTKPVDTNPSAYKRGQKDAIKVTMAAPLANLLVGFVGMFIYALWSYIAYSILPSSTYSIVGIALYLISAININLFVFNLIPLPGLAGFELFRELNPRSFYKVADKLYQYQMVILLAIVVVGQFILTIPSNLIINLFSKIAFGVLGIIF